MWFSIIGQVLTGLIALASLWKDWASYGRISKRFGRRLPVALAVFIALVASFTVWQTLVAATRQAKNIGQIEELGKQLKRNEESSERRAKQQSEHFQGVVNSLYERLSELQSKINTDPLLRQNAALMKEIKDIRTQVDAARARIEQPIEQADLVATFSERPSLPPEPDQPELYKTMVPRQADGTVQFTISVFNKSKVQARAGGIFVRLCRKCTFVTEPKGFKRAEGAPDYDRYTDMDNLPAGVAIGIPLKVKPPPLSSGFEVEVTSRCENCTVKPASKFFVGIQ